MAILVSTELWHTKKELARKVLGRDICALHLRVQRTSVLLSGSDDSMREPRQYEAPLCAQVDAELWFPETGGDYRVINFAKNLCGQCKHQVECAEWGIQNERFGIWGGTTPRQREVIRRKRNIKLPREKSA